MCQLHLVDESPGTTIPYIGVTNNCVLLWEVQRKNDVKEWSRPYIRPIEEGSILLSIRGAHTNTSYTLFVLSSANTSLLQCFLSKCILFVCI